MKIESLPLSADQPAKKPAPRRRARIIALSLLAVALAGAGAYALTHRAAAPAQAAAPAPAAAKEPVHELSVRDIARVEARPLAVTLPVTGSLMPLAQATVKSKVSGIVLSTAVQEGMDVKAGQVIAQLDPAEARARVAQQQAMLADAQARLTMARKNMSNSASLLKQNFIAQNAYDTSANAVDLAQAAVDSARAQLDLARIALADTTIHAPLSGVVSKRHAQAGEKLAPDSPVFSIVDLKHLTLDAQVPASDIPRIQVGQDVQFKVDGFDGRNFTGKVARINPATETGSRAMIVYVDVANPDGLLRAGMFAKGTVVTEKSNAHPLLPLGAVRKDNGRDVVYRIDNGKVVAQPVKLGLRNQDEGVVEALEGVDAGMTVLAVPLDGIKPGSQVKLPDAKG
ncbi:efflux RND transporter periplasmic adaptor subunit [Telluria mixta]|uniref:Efflux RND transporter periplasmic adaptor subunit n=1 Tax=Telluria mixta TaxID=34071 RepID=A0ABT2BZR5_9BURK|nr:efflux RND transporter periplasmic adaptor subunit [Telluria mixta]MCS0630622.1 efflux RND transporter periplasmic adaptor subunit [Telluria mixta]WEM98630.1 efflux RND transporter periplasmic adaptor subunit [Telluria mixta]